MASPPQVRCQTDRIEESHNGTESGRRAPRFGGVPLIAYVTVLLAIPLAALAVIGGREVTRNVREARAARQVANTVEIQTAATNVLAPLQVERIALAGTARIDELGFDREAVLGAIGTDFLAIRDDNVELLERELDTLDATLEGASFDEAPELRDRLDAARQELDDVRDAVEAMEATPTDVAEVYDEFVVLIEDIIRISEEDAADSIPAFVDARELSIEQGIAAEIMRTASAETVLIADTMIGLQTFDPDLLLLAAFAHEDALAEKIEISDPEAYAELQAERAALSDYIDDWTTSGVPTPQRVQISPELYRDFAELLTERLAYLGDVEEFAREVSGEILGLTAQLADDAADDILATIAAITLIALGALLFQLLIVRSFTVPMQRLRTNVERIGEGALEVPQLPLYGPSDVRKVTAALNDMASTLSLVDQQVQALASGDPDADDVGEELPGDVGRSLRGSVERLASLTDDLRESEERLQEEARHDGLTGLLNRFGVLELLERALIGDRAAVAVMIVDLDGFKRVNDANGHDVGDRVLLEVADRIRDALTDDDVVARIGGDEFLLVIAECRSTDRAQDIGRAVVAEIERLYRVGPLRLSLSASVGIKLVEPGTPPLTALKEVDAALYHAKRRGRGRIEMYDAALQASIEQEAEIEFALRRGVQEGELRMFLQPGADLRTGFAYGAEALVRWEPTPGDFRSPGEFIPVAEQSGLIIEIGRWVLREAAARLVEWERRAPDRQLRLAINVSGRHLMDGGFLEDLDEVIAATGANPSMLEIELTESHLLDDVERVGATLDEIRARGISVSVDDFGTGYSSMTYVRHFPLDLVKIDRTFIAGAIENRYDFTVVESIVRLAAAMGLDVIAEGVETSAQLELVRAQGITKVQGFLIARPQPVDDAEALVFGGPLLDASAVPGRPGRTP